MSTWAWFDPVRESMTCTAVKKCTDSPLTLRLCCDASYAIYLFHVPTMLAVSAVIKRIPLPQGWLQFGLMIAATMVASAMVGLVVRKYVEYPLLRKLRTPPVFRSSSKSVSG